MTEKIICLGLYFLKIDNRKSLVAFRNKYAILSQMPFISLLLPYIQVTLAVLLSVGILVQQTAAGLGGALGDNFSSSHHTRRGFEKFAFNATIVLAIAFAISAFLALIVK